MSWLDTAPLPLVGLIALASLIAAAELGYRGHRWLAARRADGAGDSGQDHLLGAVLGLLALLLGFTFSLSLSRYEARRDLVVQEANAIDTAWLRVELLQEPNRSAMAPLMRDYLHARLAWSQAQGSSPSATAAAQEKLWAATGAALRSEPSQQLSRGLMDSMNQSFDLAAARLYERQAHVPDLVLNVLALYAVLSAAMVGYTLAASGRPHRIATVTTLALVTLALVMILDLDRPRSGAIQVSQQPLTDLLASVAPPAVP